MHICEVVSVIADDGYDMALELGSLQRVCEHCATERIEHCVKARAVGNTAGVFFWRFFSVKGDIVGTQERISAFCTFETVVATRAPMSFAS